MNTSHTGLELICMTSFYLNLFKGLISKNSYILRYQRLELQHSLFLKGEHISITLSKKSKEASKPGFSNTWIENFQMFKLVLEKAEKPEIKLPTSDGSSKKQESSRKTSTSALLTMPKPLTVWITTNWKILQKMGIPDHLICLLSEECWEKYQ